VKVRKVFRVKVRKAKAQVVQKVFPIVRKAIRLKANLLKVCLRTVRNRSQVKANLRLAKALKANQVKVCLQTQVSLRTAHRACRQIVAKAFHQILRTVVKVKVRNQKVTAVNPIVVRVSQVKVCLQTAHKVFLATVRRAKARSLILA
jgi:3'-phosphoadenosine 5'-phosphosulfate sulfotransferase